VGVALRALLFFEGVRQGGQESGWLVTTGSADAHIQCKCPAVAMGSARGSTRAWGLLMQNNTS